MKTPENRRRIALVEDDAELRSLTSAMLEEDGIANLFLAPWSNSARQ